MYMDVTQKTICVAHWTTGKFQFLVLRHEIQHYLWVLRYERVVDPSDGFLSHLFFDIIADHDNVVPVSNQYLLITLSRIQSQTIRELCVDDYSICSYHKRPCEYGDTVRMRLSCPDTCNICNSTNPGLCRIDRKMRGSWLSPNTPHVVINVEEQLFNIAATPTLHCIDWDTRTRSSNQPELPQEQMFVSVYQNGCRAQYRCAQFTRPSSSVLFYKLSSPRRWPLIASPSEDVTCHNFEYSSHFQAVVSDSRSVPVECNLTRFRDSEVRLRSGTQCSVEITQPHSLDSVTVDWSDCGETDIPTHHMCLETVQLLENGDHILMTKSGLTEREVLCWIFPQRKGQRNNFYILNAKHCNEVASKRIRKGRLDPVASFTRSRRSVTTRVVSTLEADNPDAYGAPEHTEDYIKITHDNNPDPSIMQPNLNRTMGDVDSLPSPYIVGAVIIVFLAVQVPCFVKCR